jgi:hypothetical protein
MYGFTKLLFVLLEDTSNNEEKIVMNFSQKPVPNSSEVRQNEAAVGTRWDSQ